MNPNPYETPLAEPASLGGVLDKEYIEIIALRRKHVQRSIFLYVGVMLYAFFEIPPFIESVAILIKWMMIVVFIYIAVSAYRLGRALSGSTVGILYFLGTFFPILGVVPLFVLSFRAKRIIVSVLSEVNHKT